MQLKQSIEALFLLWLNFSYFPNPYVKALPHSGMVTGRGGALGRQVGFVEDTRVEPQDGISVPLKGQRKKGEH